MFLLIRLLEKRAASSGHNLTETEPYERVSTILVTNIISRLESSSIGVSSVPPEPARRAIRENSLDTDTL